MSNFKEVDVVKVIKADTYPCWDLNNGSRKSMVVEINTLGAVVGFDFNLNQSVKDYIVEIDSGIMIFCNEKHLELVWDSKTGQYV
jgi:hypothetical protein